MSNTFKASLVAISTIGFILLNKDTRAFVKELAGKCTLMKSKNDSRKLKPEQISFC